MNFKITNILFVFLLLSACSTDLSRTDTKETDDLNITTTEPPVFVTGNGITYYISNSGDDSSDGLSESTPIKSISRLNEIELNPGDQVLFNRGDLFRGYPQIFGGSETAWIRYSSYGEGEKPIITGSVDVGDEELWVRSNETNIWHSTIQSATYEVGALYLGSETFGSKKWEEGELKSSGDFYFNNSDDYVYIYSEGNPALVFDEVEAALTRHIIDIDHISYVLLEGLHISRGAAHGIAVSDVSNIIIRENEISYVGGGELSGYGEPIRFGNGIEFWTQVTDILVESNYIHDIYDTAVTNQGHSRVSTQRNIHYKNNLLVNCGLASFEIWLRPESSQMRDIFFTHNTSINPGIGWGSERPDKNSFHIASYGSTAQGSNLVIKNNVFYNSVEPEGVDYIETFALLFYMDSSDTKLQDFSINKNLWYKENPLWVLNSSEYQSLDWDSWKSFSGQSSDGLFIEPTFSDFLGGDYTLTGELADMELGYSSN